MKDLSGWIKTTRPLPCLFGFLLSLGSWAIAYKTISLLAVYSSIECYWYMTATMVMNAWFDRYHDLKKTIPVDFVVKNEKAYFRFTIICWLIEVTFIASLFLINPRLGILATVRSFIGFFYGWTRKVALLPGIVVAIDTALCTATPAVVGSPNAFFWIFSFGTCFLMFGRENIKDIEDFKVDYNNGKPYKKTLPVCKGPNVARLATRISFVFGLILYSAASVALPLPALWSGIFCLVCVSWAALIIANNWKSAKKLHDVGVGLFFLILNASFWLLRIFVPLGFPVFNSYSILVLAFAIMWLLRHQAYVSRLVDSILDEGIEYLDGTRQGNLLWPSMYSLFWLVVFVSRSIISYSAGNLNYFESLLTAAVQTIVLILLVTLRPPHIRVSGRTYGYTFIERFSVGLVIGFFFASMEIIGIPISLTAFLLPLLSILCFNLESLCRLLRGYGCLWGIVTAIAIVKGACLALAAIMPVYLVIVLVYYSWRRFRKIPVYIPSNKIGNVMLSLALIPQ